MSPPPIALAEVIERFEADYLAKHRPHHDQLQALAAFKRCRTRLAPRMVAQCGNDSCQAQRVVPHSCGHRHCPHCQHFESQRWIERQTRQLVDGPYFLITFTLPAELRPLAWAHPRSVYAALMDCAWQTLRAFSQNHRQLRGTPGAVAVLHTHTRALGYHPHVHLAMPAAALDADQRLWRRLRRDQGYLFNHKALAKVFRAKLLDHLKAQGLSLPATPARWVVDCKRLGHGAGVLAYLGRYLYRGVIQERDILRCDDTGVTYRWRDSKTRTLQQRTVPGATFLAMVLQHVLPKGFRRARNYGFLHPNSKRLIALLRLLVFKPAAQRPAPEPMPRPALRCTCCGGVMRIVARRVPPAGAPPGPAAMTQARPPTAPRASTGAPA
jgi:hypothetical protein